MRAVLQMMLVVPLMAGCGAKDESKADDTGGDADTDTATTDTPPKAAGKPWDAAKGTATISGSVKWEGDKRA